MVRGVCAQSHAILNFVDPGMGGPGDGQALLAKARAAGPTSLEKPALLNSEQNSFSSNLGSSSRTSWREAAKSVNFNPPSGRPKIHDFERSVLPSLRTLRAQFLCGLCPVCNRPLIQSVLPQHIADCKERAAREREVKLETASAKPSFTNSNGSAELDSERRKRKLADEIAGQSPLADDADFGPPTQKRAKTTTKAKAAKKTSKQTRNAKASKPPKQPKQHKEKSSANFSPDKNCGVPLPSGQPCMRSLTCKQHSMGAKRAVVGRSAAYDLLLANYHRQHQMKQAQISATAAQAAQLESDQLQEAQAQQNPEHEVQQVLEGISRVFSPPLATQKVTSSYSRVANFRLREMLSVSLLPKRLPPTGDVLYGRSLTYQQDSPERFMYVRSQAVQQAIYVSQLQQRQQQVRQQQLRWQTENELRSQQRDASQGESPGEIPPAQKLNSRMTAQQQVQQRLKQASHQ